MPFSVERSRSASDTIALASAACAGNCLAIAAVKKTMQRLINASLLAPESDAVRTRGFLWTFIEITPVIGFEDPAPPMRPSGSHRWRRDRSLAGKTDWTAKTQLRQSGR